MKTSSCPLCASIAVFFQEHQGTVFYKCGGCRSVFRDSENDLTPAEEKKRYDLHCNDPTDPDYREYVSPIITAITERFKPGDRGLDFGSGPGAIVSTLLREKGYDAASYDPFYDDNRELLSRNYDYIACSEVIEHFRSPAKEFANLRKMIKPGGALFCLTRLYEEEIDFSAWFYKNDPTHRFFYSRQALEWIKVKFDFSSLAIEGRLIVYRSLSGVVKTRQKQ
ncbi:MAG: class I SAM-dependent methyltransferase [Candidatus Margulisbacteria bacterium]|nr:class I SAM-dependent methyltransferase [Candidatus Margulisiibacteriota bacterium]MBU1617550.1 class I SAM-dependent methyltransferase [Candidatus Margulisiibacteriota bacterium]MBU1867211.1 class I SAM-dependent methyltransferase [Candidatus Margulisiibacteriota bacterium]